MIKKYFDKKFNFSELFNTKTGFYLRTGILDDNGNDTNKDAFMRSFPALIDVGIMGHCAHGKSGLCQKAGIQCYQDGPHSNNKNMTLENYKKIIDEGKEKGLFQVAVGGAGDPDMHENFEEIMKYSAENDITPNFTTSGLGMTPEKAMICKKYCGAVAVSMYSRLDIEPFIALRYRNADEEKVPYKSIDDIPVVFTMNNKNKLCYIDEPNYIINGKEFRWEYKHHITEYDLDGRCELYKVYEEKNNPNYTFNAIEMLLNAGVKTNVHYVLGNNTIDEAIIRLQHDGFPKGINAVIFLLHKPVGLGQDSNVLNIDDHRVKKFFDLIENKKHPFKIGFDSCTVPALLNMTKNILAESMDSCEGGRYSMYITADMIALPCSFDNQNKVWAYDISNDSIENAWNSCQFDDFRSHFCNSCSNCKQREACYGGCPICRNITMCNKTEKDLK